MEKSKTGLACFVEGELFQLSQVKTRTMNFRQHWRTDNIIDYKYFALVPFDLVYKLLEILFKDYYDDCLMFEDESDVLFKKLQENKISALSQATSNPPIMDDIVEYFDFDIVQFCFDKVTPESGKGFVINTIDSIKWSGDKIIISGRGRLSPQNVQYQDV